MATTRRSAPLAVSEPSHEPRDRVAPSAALDARLRLGFGSVEERRRVLDWLNGGLRNGRPRRLTSEYPLLFAPDTSAIPVTLWTGTTPVAFCMLWPATFRVGAHRLRTGMISLVYTDPAARGRGHASRVVRAAIDHATSLELGLLLLWSELDALYTPLGFVEAGHESLLVLDSTTVDRALHQAQPPPGLQVGVATPDDWNEIERLRGTRICQLELDPGDLSRARSIPALDVRVARDAEGIQGFAMRGRGDDFAEVIHEWGGDAAAALVCCESLLASREPGDELVLMTPPSGDALSWALRRSGARRIRKPLAWMRIASPEAFASDVRSMLPGLAGLTVETEPSADEPLGEVRLRSATGETRIEPSRLFDALFGCGRPQGPDARALAPTFGAAARDHLPIPLFVWGLESI